AWQNIGRTGIAFWKCAAGARKRETGYIQRSGSCIAEGYRLGATGCTHRGGEAQFHRGQNSIRYLQTRVEEHANVVARFVDSGYISKAVGVEPSDDQRSWRNISGKVEDRLKGPITIAEKEAHCSVTIVNTSR